MSTTVTVNNANATLTLGNLNQTYSGAPEAVTVTTSPPGLTVVTVTYNGSTPPTSAGSYAVVASLSNPNYTANPVNGTLVINLAAPSFSNLTAPLTISYSTPSVTLGGKLAAGSLAAAGSVTVTLNGVSQSASLDASGNFSTTFNTAALPVSASAYPVTYSYTVTTNFAAASNTTSTTVTVNPASTTTTVNSAANPSIHGQPVSFSATVAANPPGAGIPTGSMQFQIDGMNFGSPVTLVGGRATSGAISSLSVTTHTIKANYIADASFTASAGLLTQTVNTAPSPVTQIQVDSSQAPTFTFTVTGTDPGGPGLIQFSLYIRTGLQGSFGPFATYIPFIPTGNGTYSGSVTYTFSGPAATYYLYSVGMDSYLNWELPPDPSNPLKYTVVSYTPPAMPVTVTSLAVPQPKGGSLSQINLTFSAALDAASAASLAPYQLKSAGPDRMFGTRDDKAIPLKNASYNTATNSLVLTPAKKVALNQPLELIINPSRGLLGPNGQPISGNGPNGGLIYKYFGTRARRKHARH
jgi:hypothetical protein